MTLSRLDSSEFRWWTALALAFALMLVVNPAGFLGGGLDDWQYLNAALCWVQSGPCLPHDHWQGRWPVIGPLAALIAVGGESRLAVSVAPFLENAAALSLYAMIANRLCGKPVGFVAALLFLAIPSFSFQLTEPSVEPVELLFIFAGTLATIEWQSSHKPTYAFLAGLMFSLAVQVRETAIIAAAFVAVWVFVRRDRPALNHLLWAALGFAVPLLLEFIIYWGSTGDPFWRRRLSMAHTRIVSSELLGPVDSTHLPFFNKAYIANWRMQPGLHLHWAVDGFINLFVNATAGLSLVLTPLLLLTYNRIIPRPERRAALGLWLIGLLYCAVLVYAFAVDPKPRMMLVALSLTTAALALVTIRLFRCGKVAIVATVGVVTAAIGLGMQYSRPSGERMERVARQWIADHPDQIETDINTHRNLALLPEARALPSVLADRPYYMTTANRGCDYFLQRTRLQDVLAVDGSAASSPMGNYFKRRAEICLFRYLQPLAGERMDNVVTDYVDGEAREWAVHPTLAPVDR